LAERRFDQVANKVKEGRDDNTLYQEVVGGTKKKADTGRI
jgi:hypothetical protein